ncbi:MAG: hypothetical protein JEY91_00790 [Spirochaetaceae bacterium]|nr:hypothetical protein [Spirochaetaceae bacterium]
MNKFLLIFTIISLLFSTSLYSQESEAEDELYPMRIALTNLLFPQGEPGLNRIRQAFLSVKRELFIDTNYRSVAYKNMPIPTKGGLIQPAPQMIASILIESGIQPEDKILIIGQNTRYISSIINELTNNIYVLDPGITNSSGLSYNVKKELSYYGWVEEAPFHIIILFGAVEEIPQSLISQLIINGKIIAPLTYGTGSQILTSSIRYTNGFEVQTIGDSYIHRLK